MKKSFKKVNISLQAFMLITFKILGKCISVDIFPKKCGTIS